MRKNVKLALIFNILILTMEIVAFSQTQVLNLFSKMYYCSFANVLALIASALMIVFILVKKEINEVPFIVVVLRYMASVSLSLVTIALFLLIIPMEYGFGNYVTGASNYLNEFGYLLLHILCPIMSATSFIFFEGDRRLNKKKTMYYPCLFSIVYAVVTSIMVLTSKIEGPYEFFRLNDNPWYISVCWMVVVIVANYLIARYELLFNQIKAPRIKIKR